MSKSSQVEELFTRKEFDILNKNVQRILDIVEGRVSTANLLLKAVWDNSDLKRFLNISDSTIERGRKDGRLKFFMVGRSYRYYRDDILPFRDEFLK